MLCLTWSSAVTQRLKKDTLKKLHLSWKTPFERSSFLELGFVWIWFEPSTNLLGDKEEDTAGRWLCRGADPDSVALPVPVDVARWKCAHIQPPGFKAAVLVALHTLRIWEIVLIRESWWEHRTKKPKSAQNFLPLRLWKCPANGSAPS